jgi:hypothetical protein
MDPAYGEHAGIRLLKRIVERDLVVEAKGLRGAQFLGGTVNEQCDLRRLSQKPAVVYGEYVKRDEPSAAAVSEEWIDNDVRDAPRDREHLPGPSLASVHLIFPSSSPIALITSS